MSTLRFRALEKSMEHLPLEVELPDVKTSNYFGVDVFDQQTMKAYLSREAYQHIVEIVEKEKGSRLERKFANQVAIGMKAWALERGATHYTHWFHPLNGTTAEKHDAFFEPASRGSVIENFAGDLLVQQEPDASSFPSGGLRNTFEARGYTAWDPSSPAFVYGRTLCIPTIFVSYTGEALDYKTPLMKSLNFIDRAAVEVCQLFERDVTSVNVTLGWEQEYFLVDESLFMARPDLALTGRTLIGHSSAKDQQLSDHYFGTITERVKSFMREFEVEAYKLGIPVKTRHNEVAPNQFECAPMFEEANLAVDHNQLIMTIMDKVARKHHFRVLFHEKPFDKVNGSGKHNNWSLMNNMGKNLLAPGKTPKTNLQFLTFLINTVKAVDEHADLLRSSIAICGNEYRLGANEAPPAIMSVFIGTKLTEMLDALERRVPDSKMTPNEKTELKLDVGKIPEILMDNTDRNRTSPFAFTGNRFEFRAVGSSANVAAPMIALNTVVAAQFVAFRKAVDALVEKGTKKDEAIFQVLKQYIADSKKIRFEGNGYSQEWIDEAEGRGLTNISNIPEALKAFLFTSTRKVFKQGHVLSDRELEARHEIRLETFIKRVQIESRVMGDLVRNHIIPTAIKYQNVLITNVKGLKDLYPGEIFDEMARPQMSMISRISEHIAVIKDKVEEMIATRKRVNQEQDIPTRAALYSTDVVSYFESIRYHVDKLELVVDDELWPFPKYRELLFTR